MNYPKEEELTDLVHFGTELGIEAVKEGVEVMPYLVYLEGNEKKLKRFALDSDDGEKSYLLAKEFLKNMKDKPNYAIIGFYSYVHLNGKEFDAIRIEAFKKNDAKIYCFIQRFSKKLFRKLKLIGNVSFWEEEKMVNDIL